MASMFMKKLEYLNEDSKKVLRCFFNEMKYNVDEHFGKEYWIESKPADIIDITN